MNSLYYEQQTYKIYWIFTVLAVLAIVLALFNQAYLMMIVPVVLLVGPYVKKISWTKINKFYIALLLLIPKSAYEVVSSMPIDTTPHRVLAFIMIGVWIYDIIVNPDKRWFRTGIEVPFILLAITLIASVVINMDRYSSEQLASSIKSLFLMTSYGAIMYLVANTMHDEDSARGLARWIASIAIIIAAFGIVERLTSFNAFRHLQDYIPFLKADTTEFVDMERGQLRITGSFDHPIVLAAVLPMLVPLMLHFVVYENVWVRKAWFGAGAIVALVASLFTISATAFVGYIAASLASLVMRPRRGVVLITILILFAIGASIFLQDDLSSLTQRMSVGYIEKSEIGNEQGRLTDYPRVWQSFQQNPLIGVGFGSFDPIKEFNLILDNQYLGFILETGLLGLLAFVWFFYALIHRAHKASTTLSPEQASMSAALCSGLTVFAAVCFTFDTFGFAQIVYLFFVMAGLTLALQR